MAFQIQNKHGEPIRMAELDAQAAVLWNKEVEDRFFATPLTMPAGLTARQEIDFYVQNTNWFEKIGWAISEGAQTWEDVRNYLLSPFVNADWYKGADELMELLPQYKKYFELIAFWEGEGYIPVQVKR